MSTKTCVTGNNLVLHKVLLCDMVKTALNRGDPIAKVPMCHNKSVTVEVVIRVASSVCVGHYKRCVKFAEVGLTYLSSILDVLKHKLVDVIKHQETQGLEEGDL